MEELSFNVFTEKFHFSGCSINAIVSDLFDALSRGDFFKPFIIPTYFQFEILLFSSFLVVKPKKRRIIETLLKKEKNYFSSSMFISKVGKLF